VTRVLKIAIPAVLLVGLAALTFSPKDETPTIALGAPHFVDETASAGIDHIYTGDSTFAVGGGVAVLDCDGDGAPDLYFAGGSNPAALYRNDSPVGGPLKFTRLPDPATDLIGVLGAYPIDIAGDGNVDLVLLRKGESVILRGLGACRFARANESLSFDAGAGLTTAFSATWEGSAPLPTLALGRYLQLDATGAPAPSYDCDANALLRPNSDGSSYAPPTPLTPGYCTLSILFSDWDRSGRRDLRMTNDRQYYVHGEDQLWRIASGEAPRLYTDADGWVSLQVWGMGIATFDVTGHGYPDVFLTSQGDNKLQTLAVGAAQPRYRDIALKRGVTAAQPFTGGDVRPSTAWHPEFQDVNNDGFIDLFVSKGNVSSMPDYASRDPSNLLLGQADGTFDEAADAAGILNYGRGRGAALADFTLSGMLDLVEVNYGEPVRLWRNVGSGTADRPVLMGNWIQIRLDESGPNRDAIGAWIEVRVGNTTLRRELTIGGGHASGELGWTHFGLGPAHVAQVRVQWPDGEVGPWQQASANQFVVIERGAAQVRPWRISSP
jgi:enediyne biosynthesis protein E4